jgi:hypothetical protein
MRGEIPNLDLLVAIVDFLPLVGNAGLDAKAKGSAARPAFSFEDQSPVGEGCQREFDLTILATQEAERALPGVGVSGIDRGVSSSRGPDPEWSFDSFEGASCGAFETGGCVGGKCDPRDDQKQACWHAAISFERQ